MHSVADRQVGERRVPQREVNQRQLQGTRRRQVIDRQTHPIDRNRAVLYHKLGEARRQSKVDETRISLLPDVFDRRDAVDMALHEVSAEPVADFNRALEVYSLAGAPSTDRRPAECRLHGRDGEPAGAVREHGQASAVDRDAFAVAEIRVARFNTELATSIGNWFETVWTNHGPPDLEYTAEFGAYADPAQGTYWLYRLMESTGLSTF